MKNPRFASWQSGGFSVNGILAKDLRGDRLPRGAAVLFSEGFFQFLLQILRIAGDDPSVGP